MAVGPEFRRLEAAWIEGVAAMARAGAQVVVDEVFLGGADSRRRRRRALGGLRVLWVGVRCDGAVAAGREVARGDRIAGMAAPRADPVHRGVVHDLEVDTTHSESMGCARAIAVHVVRSAARLSAGFEGGSPECGPGSPRSGPAAPSRRGPGHSSR
ncbi:hypothetical protein CTZ28_13830 [Streptomyces shenzhenensis]|uniref:Chloramphenicol phosphotransferase n=1 Tax=Streptomyces shenzhenensis TaxID=943815 RepID=A0A3M0IA16_9ACTN|nr:hypothetical protein CTZ28_13830 [Streptomyces shenzhenensis]